MSDVFEKGYFWRKAIYGEVNYPDEQRFTTIKPLEYSEWQCHLFGSNGQGISWRPVKGQEPNQFWRKMQYLCFGNKWVKDGQE